MDPMGERTSYGFPSGGTTWSYREKYGDLGRGDAIRIPISTDEPKEREEIKFEPKPRPEGDPLSPACLMWAVEGLALGHQDRKFDSFSGGRAADYLESRMKEIGLEAADGKFQHRFGSLKGSGHNVIGVLPGSDPVLKDEYVIVSAHYDSQKATHQGANDNASGVACALAIAEKLAKNPPKRSVVIIAFDGEEVGKKGSNDYVSSPVFKLAKTALLVNLDMVGQVHLESGPRSDIYQWASSDAFAQSVLEKANAKALKKNEVPVLGYPDQPYESQFFTTDAQPFYERGVPIINLLSGRDLDNHSPEDSMDRVIPERIAQYARLGYEAALEAANRPEPINDILGKPPGDRFAAFSMIDWRRDQFKDGIDEEAARIGGLEMRLPDYREVSNRLIAAIEKGEHLARAGVTLEEITATDKLVSEPSLNRVRERKFELVEAYHEIPKDDEEARRAPAEKLNALSGIEGVLSGAIYLGKIGFAANKYQRRRLPEKLEELVEGAKKLGLDDLIAPIRAEDAGKLEPIVTPERALSIARETLDRLDRALMNSVDALCDQLESRDQRDEIRSAAKKVDSMFGWGGLRDSNTLEEVSKGLGVVRGLIRDVKGAEQLGEEVTFWIGWLKTFLPIEAFAGKAVREKKRALEGSKEELERAFKEVSKKLPWLDLSSWEKDRPRPILSALQARRDSKKKDLESTKKDLESAKKDLESAKNDLESAKRDLEPAKSEVEPAKRELEAARGELAAAKALDAPKPPEVKPPEPPKEPAGTLRTAVEIATQPAVIEKEPEGFLETVAVIFRPPKADRKGRRAAEAAKKALAKGKTEPAVAKQEPEPPKKPPQLPKRDPELEKKLGELEKKAGELEKKAGELEKKAGELEKKVREIDKKVGELNKRVGELQQSFAEAEVHIRRVRPFVEIVSGLEDLEHWEGEATKKRVLEAAEQIGEKALIEKISSISVTSVKPGYMVRLAQGKGNSPYRVKAIRLPAGGIKEASSS
jgi:peptidase M28-like protein